MLYSNAVSVVNPVAVFQNHESFILLKRAALHTYRGDALIKSEKS